MVEASSDVLAPVASAIAHDVACRGCGYNLRGLYPEGVCPECGGSVAESLRGNWLRHAAPEYVASVRKGISFVLLSFIIGGVLFLSILSSMCIGFAAGFVTPSAIGWVLIVVLIARLATIGVLSIVYPIGCWKLGRPDPAAVSWVTASAADARVAQWTTVMRMTGLILMPTLLAWKMASGLVFLAPHPAIAYVIMATTYVAFVFTWVHLVGMGTAQLALYQRCMSVDERQRRKDEKLLRALRRSAIWIPVVILAGHITLHLVLPVFAPAAVVGLGAPVGAPFHGIGSTLMTLLWLSTVSATRRVSRAVRNEVAAMALERQSAST